ncbi:phosphatidate cytidylyltransferase, mitochondrial [Chelonus insularis]|uniref:phosphatidate cytidylyltransferase, mitochondrial n=1 Tax=Chelonus insularis TaxID=460826 RepID=UPI00158B1618|nr:phosphatidate cytidylyltransferase, mitochondrial [Chelonus insularis]
MEKIILSPLQRILQEFPKNIKFCFAYGSGVFKQKTDPTKNMLDLIFVVSNPKRWHSQNLMKNPSHYAQPLRFLGPKVIANVQEKWGARIYYNTLIKSSDERLMKYGVISEVALIEDLLDWNMLYLSGRLHKPVQVLIGPENNSSLQTALAQNLKSAVHAALLLLPEDFNQIDFYKTIASLSYHGDFRMTFGEDKSKINNIVIPQIENFKLLYAPVLKFFDHCMEMSSSEGGPIMCRQDGSPTAKIHHLNQLPRVPQVKLVRKWSQGSRTYDVEDCLRAIAYDPECNELVQEVFKEIVRRSSITQSLKGILTAGIAKSVKYSSAKIVKMIQSNRNIYLSKQLIASALPVAPKINKIMEKVTKKIPPKAIEKDNQKKS